MPQTLLTAIVYEDDGVLSFEWVLLVTLLTIGIVSGLAAARDAIIDELGDLSEATLSFDQSYSIAPFSIPGLFTAAGSTYTDDGYIYADCGRVSAAAVPGQDPAINLDNDS